MDRITTRRPIAAMVKLTAASVVALTVAATVATPPPTPNTTLPRSGGQIVELAALPEPLQSFWDLVSGADPAYPLPIPSNPIAPVAEQWIRNLASYGAELVAGKGAQIPGQISVRINNVGTVLGSVPNYLVNDISSIGYGVGAGAFFGFLAGAFLVGSAVQTFFPDSESGSVGALVIQVGVVVGAFSGVVVGAVLGLAAAPFSWLANAIRFRNSLAMALASPVPLPAPGSQATAVAAVTAIDPKSGDSAIEPGPSTSTKRLTMPKTAAVERVVPSQPQTVIPAVSSAESEVTAGLVERIRKEHPTSAVQPATEDAAFPASQTPSSLAAPTTASRLSKKMLDRAEAKAGGATQTKGGLGSHRSPHKPAA
jgi:hypothetical protein